MHRYCNSGTLRFLFPCFKQITDHMRKLIKMIFLKTCTNLQIAKIPSAAYQLAKLILAYMNTHNHVSESTEILVNTVFVAV